MNQINALLQSLFDDLASEIQSRLLPGSAGDAQVSADEARDRTSTDVIWWSWSLSIDSGCRVLAGASSEAWTEICGLDTDITADDFGVESLAPVTSIVQEAARKRFGSEVSCAAAERSEEPPREWATVSAELQSADGDGISMNFGVTPDLENALGGSVSEPEAPEEQDLAPRIAPSLSSADILMHVEMPVTIVLGRTKMRLKDLLKLTNGSVVELDQMLDDEVEVRINNCVIAYGEVVAVDGNYAVRIIRMAAARNTPSLRGALPGKAA